MNKTTIEIGRNWLEANAVARASGLYQFLKISPSYALAHLIRTTSKGAESQIDLVSELYGVAQSEKKFVQILDGFKKVLKTYDVVGDVYARYFDTWFIKDKGYRLFGYEEAPPKAFHITSLKNDEPLSAKHTDAISNFFALTREGNGNPPLHMLAVPAGVGVTKQIELLKEILVQLENNTPKYVSSTPYFAFKGQRFRLEPLEKYLKTLALRAMSPKRPLWQLAAITELSSTIRFDDPWNEKPTSKNEDERSVLNSLAYRAISRAQRIAEHASQGTYPSHEAICIPQYDWAEVAQRITGKQAA